MILQLTECAEFNRQKRNLTFRKILPICFSFFFMFQSQSALTGSTTAIFRLFVGYVLRGRLICLLPEVTIEKNVYRIFPESDQYSILFQTGLRSNRDYFPTIIVPIPLEGGMNYRLNWVFFVQTILTDRYFHRGVVSDIIKMPVQRGIQKCFFFRYSFCRASYRGLEFCEY